MSYHIHLVEKKPDRDDTQPLWVGILIAVLGLAAVVLAAVSTWGIP